MHCGAVCGGGVQEGKMQLSGLSASFQSLPPLPTNNLGPSGADSRVGGFVYVLGPCGSLQWTLLWGWDFLQPPQSSQVFKDRGFEALFPHAGAMGCVVCLTPQLLLPVYLHTNMGPPTLPATISPGLGATTLPTLVLQVPPCCKSSPPWLPVFTPPTGLDDCFFFNSLVVRLPCSLIFWQFWLFF